MDLSSRTARLFHRNESEHSEWFCCELFYSLPPAFKTQVDDLIKEGLGNIDKDRYFSEPYAHLLAIEKRKVIGVTELFKRELIYEQQALTMGGFGFVTISKKKRRRGVATALLNRGMMDFKMQKFDTAFLITDINQAMIGLYGKVGFVPLEKPFTYIGQLGTRYTEHNGMLAPVNSRDIFNRIINGKEILDIGLGAW